MADEHLQMHSSKFPMDHIGSRDRLVAISASADGLDNPSLEDPYSVYRGSIRGPTVQGSPGGVYGRSGPSVAVGTDTLRDTCSRMFQRDAWGRSSQNILQQSGPQSQSMSSPGFSEPADSGPPVSTVCAADFEPGKGKNGTLTKKYYHIKDMLSNRFGKNSNDSKTGRGSQNNARSSPSNDRLTAVNSSFRKAIQRSSHKSNLNESSSQVYNMQEAATTASPYVSNHGNGGSYMRMNALPLPPPPPHPSPMDGGPVYGSCKGRPPSYPPPPPVSGIYGTVTHQQTDYSAVQQRSEAWLQTPAAGQQGHMEPVYGVSGRPAAGPATPQRNGPISQGSHHTPPCSPLGPEGSGRADRSYIMSNGNGGAATSQSYDPLYMSRQEIRGGPPPTSVSNGGSSQPPPADVEHHAGVAANNSTSEPASDFMATHRQSYQSQNHQSRLEPAASAGKPKQGITGGQSSGNDSEWVDLVESELREILAPGGAEGAGTSATPPLPAFSFDDSPDQSPPTSPKLSLKYPLSYSASALNQPDLIEAMAAPYASGRPGAAVPRSGPTIPSSLGRGWNPSATRTPFNGAQENRDQIALTTGRRQCIRPSNRKLASVSSTGAVDGMAGDGASVNTALDMESILDQTTDITSDEGSTVMEGSPDGLAVRKQLEGLETMYSEVLRLLGGQRRTSQQCRPPRVSALPRHRVYGSMSSLPSSVGGRPTKDRRRDDRKKLKEIKTVSKRFQRLESHVVTLARSVAHLSSEMRSQHMMLQEMENIRAQLNQLRTAPARMSAPHQRPANEWEAFRDAIPSLTHPGRVRKLTKFFGDEPPLLRIFLKKLGYEKFALLFEREKIGMIELPYMTEERLQKLGIPVGPRLRILQEAQMSLRNDNYNVYIL